ncbi:MAG: dihydrodipicolinate synthase family protein [Bacteroidetes bacterium]|nr:MAG: dihydrodipicolinate synthase family protein [Bacteroidota bacterium]
MAVQWKGVFPALVTPFTPDDRLDIRVFGENLSQQISAGIDGIIIGGSLGEASTLTQDEKESLVKFSVQKIKGKLPVILNIAEGSTHEAIEQASLAQAWGAQGLMLLPPMRYKSDDRETVQFFRDVSASTDLPILLYNNPIDYKIEITLDMFASLTDCVNIQAVKESTRDVTNVTRMINRFGERYKLLCGVDTIIMEELSLGAVGWVAGLVNAFPRETVAIYRLMIAGRTTEAREIFRWFLPVLELDIHPKLVQYIKFASSMTGMGSETVRKPRLTLEGEERKKIEGIVKQAIATRPDLPDYLAL